MNQFAHTGACAAATGLSSRKWCHTLARQQPHLLPYSRTVHWKSAAERLNSGCWFYLNIQSWKLETCQRYRQIIGVPLKTNGSKEHWVVISKNIPKRDGSIWGIGNLNICRGLLDRGMETCWVVVGTTSVLNRSRLYAVYFSIYRKNIWWWVGVVELCLSFTWWQRVTKVRLSWKLLFLLWGQCLEEWVTWRCLCHCVVLSLLVVWAWWVIHVSPTYMAQCWEVSPFAVETDCFCPHCCTCKIRYIILLFSSAAF